jgi:hypothetical protein
MDDAVYLGEKWSVRSCDLITVRGVTFCPSTSSVVERVARLCPRWTMMNTCSSSSSRTVVFYIPKGCSTESGRFQLQGPQLSSSLRLRVGETKVPVRDIVYGLFIGDVDEDDKIVHVTASTTPDDDDGGNDENHVSASSVCCLHPGHLRRVYAYAPQTTSTTTTPTPTPSARYYSRFESLLFLTTSGIRDVDALDMVVPRTSRQQRRLYLRKLARWRHGGVSADCRGCHQLETFHDLASFYEFWRRRVQRRGSSHASSV